MVGALWVVRALGGWVVMGGGEGLSGEMVVGVEVGWLGRGLTGVVEAVGGVMVTGRRRKGRGMLSGEPEGMPEPSSSRKCAIREATRPGALPGKSSGSLGLLASREKGMGVVV